MSSSDIARQICEEFGITWKEKATMATLEGVPVDGEVLFSSFYGNVVFEVPIQKMEAPNYFSPACLVA